MVKFISHIYRTSTECLKLCPQLLGSIYLSHHTMLGSIYYLIAVCWDHTHIFAHWNKGTLQFWKMPISYQLHVVILVQSSCLMLFVVYLAKWTWFSPLTHRGWKKNSCLFPNNIFKWIFMNENVWIPIKMSLNFVPNVPINNIPALVQIMAWWRPGAKPLSEPMMVSLLMHMCITRPQWVKSLRLNDVFMHH